MEEILFVCLFKVSNCGREYWKGTTAHDIVWRDCFDLLINYQHGDKVLWGFTLRLWPNTDNRCVWGLSHLESWVIYIKRWIFSHQ